MLQRPWLQGGLACPDLYKYFLDAMLMHAYNWLIADDSNAAVVLEASYVGFYEALKNPIYMGTTLFL